jgi:hypothetical protein
MNDDSEKRQLEQLSDRISELGTKSSQLLTFLSFAVVVALLRGSGQFPFAVELAARKQCALGIALWSWVLAIFPVVLGVAPVKEFAWDNPRYYRRVRKGKCILLWIAIILIMMGTGAFLRSI